MDQTFINWLLGGFGALIGFLLSAVVPVAGNPSPAVVLLPGTVEILRFNKGVYASS